jgi:hypothetical protein
MTGGPVIERDGDAIVIRIPMRFKRQGGRKAIIVPQGLADSEGSCSPVQEPLVRALAQAYHWQDLIDSGRFASITALAASLDVDRSYVGRILRLALLAPDIVEAILRGAEPSGLSLERLTKGVPMLWAKQRSKFSRR